MVNIATKHIGLSTRQNVAASLIFLNKLLNGENDLYQKVRNEEVKPADILPASRLITLALRIPDMIRLGAC
jgi:hypothetical protein